MKFISLIPIVYGAVFIILVYGKEIFGMSDYRPLVVWLLLGILIAAAASAGSLNRPRK